MAKDTNETVKTTSPRALEAVEAAPKIVTAFYSWQSDLSEAAHRNGIRNGLREVRKALKTDFKLVIDEATRDTPGSPNIPNKIAEKIRACDLFVADVTTITGKPRKGRRACANPNVIFELGYAVAHLGWERVILLVNENISPLADLPFDFDRHRAMHYQHDDPPTKPQKDKLASALESAIELIAKHDPPRPRDLEGKSPQEIVRERDVRNIEWALDQIHQPTLDDFVREMPDRLMSRVFWYYESFRSVVTNSLFHVSDPEVAKLFKKMLAGWDKALSGGAHYRQANNPHLNIWDGHRDPQGAKAMERIMKGVQKLESARQALLKRVRETYVEIDIDATNKAAFQAYNKDRSDVE